MATPPLLLKLLDLQDCDQRIRTLSKDYLNLPKLEAHAKQRLEANKQQVELAQQNIRNVELKVQSVELDANTRRTTITRLKDQQFNTRKNEEFQALGLEIQRYENMVSELEDQQLELMEEVDTLKPQLLAAKEAFNKTAADIEQELTEIRERGVALKDRITELKAQRETLRAPVDPEFLSVYERLIKTRGDTAVVALVEGVCKGCHMRVTAGTEQHLRERPNQLHNCEQCGRILYLH